MIISCSKLLWMMKLAHLELVLDALMPKLSKKVDQQSSVIPTVRRRYKGMHVLIIKDIYGGREIRIDIEEYIRSSRDLLFRFQGI